MTKMTVLGAAQQSGSNQTAAAIGAALLDLELAYEDVPWYVRVDPDSLDQSDPNLCVLGQLFGYWIDGLKRLFPRLRLAGQFVAAQRAGFWVNDAQPDGEPVKTDQSLARYVELTEQWRAAIVARRETWR